MVWNETDVSETENFVVQGPVVSKAFSLNGG